VVLELVVRRPRTTDVREPGSWWMRVEGYGQAIETTARPVSAV
jgi:hypothetical protein